MSLNTSRHDAYKHRSVAVVADAKLSLPELGRALGAYEAPCDWRNQSQELRHAWNGYIAETTRIGGGPASYAQAIGVINTCCQPRDRIVAAAGGLPAELTANWRTLHVGTVDIEFGYSCMGYEIAGGWGARIAQQESEGEGETIVFVGDG